MAAQPPATARRRGPASIQSLDGDILSAIFASLDHFDIVRCSTVCKSWYNVIYNSSLLKDLYYNCKKKKQGSAGSSHGPAQSAMSFKLFMEDLAMEEHSLSLINGAAEVHQWNGHGAGVKQCRMKMGKILIGVGDKVLCMWSSYNLRYLGEYAAPGLSSLLDFDFDEKKIVGLLGTQLCIWRFEGKRSTFPSKEGTFTSGSCMRYVDHEAVIGCGDGTARVFDMYSQRCSRIIRMHPGPISCLGFTEEQLILSGSSLGTIAVSDLSSDQKVALLKPFTGPTGITCLCFNPRNHLVFAGSTAGHSHCWDLRTMKPLWESRISTNVLYSMDHMRNDPSTLAVGGIDGVLRMLNQNSGELLSRYVLDKTSLTTPKNKLGVSTSKAKALTKDASIDIIPKQLRSPITCVTVGMKKVATTHNGKYIRMWKFH